MVGRYRYTRWDGTQSGFEFATGDLFDEMADDLLNNGDVRGALRRLMQRGALDRDGERMMGLNDIRRRLRERREELQQSGDPDGVFQEIADALDDIIDEERHAVEQSVAEARRSGDERRQENAQRAADDRNFRLDMMPDDLAGKVREMQSYDFESREAQQRFEQLMERLRQQLLEQQFEQVSESMKNMTAEDVQRMKEMMRALNEMIDRHNRGEDERFDEFMERFGDFFPGDPKSFDELMQQIAKQMQAAQQMLNSMSPEQRQQLQELQQMMLSDSEMLGEMAQLNANMQQMFPGLGRGDGYEMDGDPMGFDQAMQVMRDLGELDRLEDLMSNPASPQQLAEADMDRVREIMGDEVANSLDRLSDLVREMEREGLIRQRDGRLEVTPHGMRHIGSKALRDIYSRLQRDRPGQHQQRHEGSGVERTFETKPYEFGDPFDLDLQRTIRNALRRQGSGTPVNLHPDDFEIERTEHITRSATVLMLDASYSMYRDDRWGPAKKVAVALQSLMSSQYPRDYLGILLFGHLAWAVTPDELMASTPPGMQGTNMHHALATARRLLRGQTGNKQIIMITDGEPTAHITPEGQPWFTYFDGWEANQLTVEATLREVTRCTRENITINTFMLDADRSLVAFVEQMSAINGGRAFMTDAHHLGDYVMVDFLDHRRTVSRRR